ncbi:MAG: twin-arginine translocation signal domain-containing protein [Caldilineaceae bacterium]
MQQIHQRFSRRQALKLLGMAASGAALAACAPPPQGSAPAAGGGAASASAEPVEVRFWNVWGRRVRS